MTQANHPAFVRLSSLGVTTVTGKDALAFLHGQFTNRLQPLGKRAPLAGYCSPKGRLLATMRVWGEGDAISLLLPKSVEPAFLKRIRMYVLRSDVHFAADEDRTLLAGFGEEAETLLKDRLAAAGAELPAENEAAVTPDLTVVRVPDAPSLASVTDVCVRYLVLAKDPDAFSPAEDDSYWWATEAAAGIGSVFAATADRFVPQSINYELTDGVVFNKGCYPGQEVVTRIQHIGTPARRMALGLVETTVLPEAGAGVYALKGGARTLSGDVVFAAKGEGVAAVLVSIPTGDFGHELSLDAEGGIPVKLVPLPYEIRNVLDS